MAVILSTVGDIVTFAVTSIGKFASIFTATTTVGESTVLSNPVLLIPVGLTVAGFGIGALRRLFNIGR